MTEWDDFRGSTLDGWSARGGQGTNPYGKEGYWTPCGSSSGSAISASANFATITLGTETDGSILCPSSLNSVVGIKPTVGLTSRAGVIPISLRQDTVGPICRTVSDATYVLDTIVGIDKKDKATFKTYKNIPKGGYAKFLKRDGLKGKRIGVVRYPFFKFEIDILAKTYEQHLNTLRQEGAIVIDHLEIPSMVDLLFDGPSDEFTVLAAEFKINLNKYLKELVTSPVRSMADVIAFNNKNSKLEDIEQSGGQQKMITAEATNGIGEAEKAALAQLTNRTTNEFMKLMRKYKLDALVAGSGPVLTPSKITTLIAIGGFPGITVPAGYIPSLPSKIPFGIFFVGLKGYEPKLIEIAYGFEQATKIRKPPSL